LLCYTFSMASNKDREIGQRIRRARELEGLTQPELAKKIGYESATAISLIESGERSVQISMLGKIAEILHQDVQFLLTGSTPKRAEIKVALRADKSLDKSDVQQIENYIEFLKKQGRGR